jgi:hypothetical protein
MSKYSIVTVTDMPSSTIDGEYEVYEEAFAMFCVDCPAEEFHFCGWELRQTKGLTFYELSTHSEVSCCGTSFFVIC